MTKYLDHSRSGTVNTVQLIRGLQCFRLGPAVDELVRQKDWDSIIELLTPRLRLHDNEHWLHVHLFAAHFEKGDEEAFGYLVKASELDEACPLVWWNLARTYFQCEVYDDALHECKEIISLGIAGLRSQCPSCCGPVESAQKLIKDSQELIGLIKQRCEIKVKRR